MVARHLKTIRLKLADTIGRYMALLPTVNINKKEVNNNSAHLCI